MEIKIAQVIEKNHESVDHREKMADETHAYNCTNSQNLSKST